MPAGNVWSWITTAGTSIAITEPANIEKVFAGIFTGAMIKDGVLYTGNGTAAQSYTPVPLEDVVLFNCYYDNYFALTASGTLYAWNSGNWGQIGDGITSAYYTDWQKIATTTFGIKQFDISGAHSLVLMSNGEVYASGSNGPGQLGNTTVSNVPCFTKCSVSGIKQVAAGSLHSLGLKEDGSVLSWGLNDDGMLGRPQTESSVIPGLVVMQNGEPLTDIVSVGAGRYHSLALKADGTVWSFGYNLHGELGTGEPLGEDAVTNHFAKQVVDKSGAPIQDIVEIAVGTYHSLALKSDGTVYAWGLGNYGRLGTGFIGNQNCAVPVKDSTGNGVLTGIKSIGAGSFHSMAVANDGTVYTWGLNNFGQLGNNLEATSCLLPTSVVHTDGSLLSDVVKITGGEYHTMALLSDGTVYCWGSDTEGQLGSNAVSDRSSVPVRVSSYLNSGETYLSNVVDITAGTSGNMVLTADNRLFAWGKNTSDLFAVSAQKTIPIPVQAYAGKIVFDDYADDFSTAASVIVNTVVSGAINDAGDADCFVFTPALTENYTISVLDGAVSAALYDLKTGAVIEPGATQRYALKSGTSYGVKITADAVTDYQFKIGLGTEELIISAPVFSLGINGGTPLNAITAGFISGRVDIANATNSEKTAMVIMTLLDHSNTLFDVRTVQSTIPAGVQDTVTTGFNVPADYPNYKIVLSVWNNMDMMERLMPDATLE